MSTIKKKKNYHLIETQEIKPLLDTLSKVVCNFCNIPPDSFRPVDHLRSLGFLQLMLEE
jgi:hypothetical protein